MNITVNEPLVVRPIPSGYSKDPSPDRLVVINADKGLDACAFAPGMGPSLFKNITFRASQLKLNLGGQIYGPTDRVHLVSCAFDGWNTGLAMEGGPSLFWIEDSHFLNNGTVGLIIGGARTGLIKRSIFENNGWNPQGDRTDPTQTHAIYVDDKTCQDVTMEGLLISNARMNATRCCGTTYKKSVSLNNGCGVLGGVITKTIAANVVLGSHDPATGIPGGGLGINANQGHPAGMIISGNLVANLGDTSPNSDPYALGVHGTYANVAIIGNKVINWGTTGHGTAVGWGANPGVNCQCVNNLLQMPNGGKCVNVHSGTLTNIHFGFNMYWSTDPKPFRYNGQDYTWEEWKVLASDTTSHFVDLSGEFQSPGSNVLTYVRDVLGLTPGDVNAQFCEAARAYPGLIDHFRNYMFDAFKTS